MLIRKLSTIREVDNETDGEEYDIWVTSQEIDFVENVGTIRSREYSCWDEFLNYWCCCFF